MGFSQPQTIIIPVKEVTCEMDSSFATIYFRDFKLYYSPKKPFEIPFKKISKSETVLVSIAFSLKNSSKSACLQIKSIDFRYADEQLNLSKRDCRKILNATLKLIKKRFYHIKYFDNVEDKIYHMTIPVKLNSAKCIKT